MNANEARIKELALAGLSHPEVAARVTNLSPSTVRVYFNRIVKRFSEEQRERMEQARTARGASPTTTYHQPFSERLAISAEHIRIGRKLLALRLEEEMTLGDFCTHYKFSNRVTLSTMEQGYHDFTMTEVRKIADILRTSVEDLLCPPAGAIAA